MAAINGLQAIDAWCNPFDERGIREIFLDNEEVYFTMGERWNRAHHMVPYTADEFVARMDAAGIRSVCVPSLKQAYYRKRAMAVDIEHEHIAALAERHPGRIIGLAGLDPMSGMEGVRALERAVRDYGFRGAHVHPFGFGLPLNAREWWPFFAKAAELEVPVVFQTGHSAEFMPSACGKPILLDDVAIWFPELRLVGAHTGWPWTEELIAMAWKHPNVYIATSGHAPKYWDPKLVRFMNARNRGIGKVMWGTDYPLILHEESLAQVAELGLKPQALEALLHDTAAHVFGLPPRPAAPDRRDLAGGGLRRAVADKLVSLPEAGAMVGDGEVVALQSMATFTAPMAMVRELIRQGRRDLTLVCLVGGIPVDWLAAAGCLSRVVAAAVSMEQFGLCNQYRRAVERGEVAVQELSETALLARLGAGARGLPFGITRGLLGTDLVELASEDLRVIDDPFGSGRRVVACRALVPDVAIVHAHRADREGNVQMDPTALWPDIRIFPKAARRVIVTVEEVVDGERIRAAPDRVVLPSFAVDAVVHVPFGAHPTSCFPRYGYDAALHRAWVGAARDPETAREFLERHVLGPASQAEYLDGVGGVRAMASLERAAVAT